jgi:hypothetical protein
MKKPKVDPKLKNKGPIPKGNIDMAKFDELFKTCHNLPKVELHAHIGGCFRP